MVTQCQTAFHVVRKNNVSRYVVISTFTSWHCVRYFLALSHLDNHNWVIIKIILLRGNVLPKLVSCTDNPLLCSVCYEVFMQSCLVLPFFLCCQGWVTSNLSLPLNKVNLGLPWHLLSTLIQCIAIHVTS